jgi:hypothetical protein
LSSRVRAVFQVLVENFCVSLTQATKSSFDHFSYFDTITTRISSTPISSDASDIHYYFFQIVKDRQPISLSLTGALANDKRSARIRHGCPNALLIGD